MKRFALLCLLALCSQIALPAQAPATSTNHEIDTTWVPPATSYSLCPTTPTQNCVKDYLQTITDPTGAKTPITIAWGQSQNAWAPGGALYCGAWNVSLVVEYLDLSSGTPVLKQSAAVSKGVTVTAGCPLNADPASGFTVTAK